MNSKGLVIVNGLLTLVLAVAVVILFTRKEAPEGSADGGTTTADSIHQASSTEQADANAPFGNMKVVYVNTDTLWNEYRFVNNTLDKLEREQNRLKAQYESKMTKLEKDYNSYVALAKSGALSLQEQKTKEASLQEQQLELKKLEDNITQKLIIKKQQLNNEINDTILAFIERYRVAHGYDFIFQYAYLNSILAATPELDVTRDVVDKLNAEYQRFNK